MSFAVTVVVARTKSASCSMSSRSSCARPIRAFGRSSSRASFRLTVALWPAMRPRSFRWKAIKSDHGLSVHAAEMLLRFKSALEQLPEDQARAVTEFVQTRTRLLGYGVPLRPSDERLDALTLRMKSTKRDQLPFWKLHELLAAEVLRQKM